MSHPDIVNIVTSEASDIRENTENDETDSFSDGGDLGCLSAGSTGLNLFFQCRNIKNKRQSVAATEHSSSNGSINLLFLPLRRGSACRQIHPLPTIVQTDLSLSADSLKTRKYHRKADLTDEEAAHNNELYDEIIMNEFPTEDMIDKSFRDKVKLIDLIFKSLIMFIPG